MPRDERRLALLTELQMTLDRYRSEFDLDHADLLWGIQAAGHVLLSESTFCFLAMTGDDDDRDDDDEGEEWKG